MISLITGSPDLSAATLVAAWGEPLNLSVRVLLAGVFLVSATGKGWDPAGTRQALSDFGVPGRLTASFTFALPALEGLLGLALLLDGSSRPALGAASLLLLVFTLGIANLLRQRRTPPCHCFGAVHSAPVGLSTLLRALFLCLVGLLGFFLPTAALTPGPLPMALALSLSAAWVSGVSNLILWRRLRQGYTPLTRLRVGQRLPAARLVGGGWLESLLPAGKRSLLILISPGCGACRAIQADLERWKETFQDEFPILEIHPGLDTSATANRPSDGKHSIERHAFERFRLGTPGAVLVDSHGIILSPPVSGAEQIEALLRISLAEIGRM